MNETAYVIIAGLVLQLAGALLIVNPIYFWKKRKEFKKMRERYVKDMEERRKALGAEIYSEAEELKRRIEEIKEKFTIEQLMEIVKPIRIIWGIVFLVIGFILQIIVVILPIIRISS